VPFSSWRGVVGFIKPAKRPGTLEELIRLLPLGIGILPLFANVREGTKAELEALIIEYEAKVAELAADGVDFVYCDGAPPFMLRGYAGERALIRRWEAAYHVPVITSGMNQEAALRALNIKRFIGVSYFPGEINKTFAAYFTEAGFDVIDMVGMDVPFTKVQELSAYEVYRFVREQFLAHPDAEAIYMLGPGWLRSIDVVEMMERDFGVPVIHPITAQSWELQMRLHVRQPKEGYGRLLAELPPLLTGGVETSVSK